MNFKKIGIALCTSAAFGLVACGDSDSSSNTGFIDDDDNPSWSDKSSSSTGHSDGEGFTYIESEGGSYRGHGCEFKMSDKTWEYAYEEKYGKMIVETKVVCEDLDDEEYSYADKICTQTVTYDDEEIYEDCEEEKSENFETICKDGLTIEKYYDRDITEDLFKSTMKFCQKINLNPDWEYVPEGDDGKGKSSSSKKSSSSTWDDDGVESSESSGDEESSSSKAVSSSSGKNLEVFGCDDFKPGDDRWEFSYSMGGILATVVVEWLSDEEYTMTTSVGGEVLDTITESVEPGASRQSMYEDACGE